MKQTEIRTTVEKILKEAKPMMKTVDDIDQKLHSSDSRPDNDTLLKWARKAAGAGDFLNKKFLKVKAMKENEQSLKSDELRIEASQSDEKFVAAVANNQASSHVKDLRLTRNVLQSYVESVDRIISICRMHLYDSNDKKFSANL